MNDNGSHSEIFDLYLQGGLKGPELAAFEQRLSADKPFAEEFHIHRILVEGIRDHGKQELKNYLKEHGKVHMAGKSTRPTIMRYAAAAAIVLVAGVYAIVHFYISPSATPEMAINSAQEKALQPDSGHTYPVPEHLKEGLAQNEAVPLELKEESINEPLADMAPVLGQPEAAIADAGEIVPPPAKAVEEPDLAKREDNIQVLSEKRLKDTLVAVPVLYVFLEPEKKVELEEVATSRSKATAYKKDQSPKIPGTFNNNMSNNSSIDNVKLQTDSVRTASGETKSKGAFDVDAVDKGNSNKKIQVEFWQSPVHFRGYKYTGNTIILYSVQAASARIFNVNGKTYLRTEGIVYLLESCADGCEFKPETNKQIIDFILQQP